jgi:hypothetical protein
MSIQYNIKVLVKKFLRNPLLTNEQAILTPSFQDVISYCNYELLYMAIVGYRVEAYTYKPSP